tara:strand:- start:227 stop:841 length:615 start_codon:yes stop_codon:yes gene_type:complete
MPRIRIGRGNALRALGIEKKSEQDLKRAFKDLDKILEQDIDPVKEFFVSHSTVEAAEHLDEAKMHFRRVNARLNDALSNIHIVERLAESLERVVPEEKTDELEVIRRCKIMEVTLRDLSDDKIIELMRRIATAKTFQSGRYHQGNVRGGGPSGITRDPKRHSIEAVRNQMSTIYDELRPALDNIRQLFILERDMRKDIIESIKS